MKEDRENLDALGRQLQTFYEDYYGSFKSPNEEWQQLVSQLEPREPQLETPVTTDQKNISLASFRKGCMNTKINQEAPEFSSELESLESKQLSSAPRKTGWRWIGLAASLVLIAGVLIVIAVVTSSKNETPKLASNPTPNIPTVTPTGNGQFPVISGLQEVTVEPAFTNMLLQTGPKLNNLTIKLFASDEASGKVIEQTEAAFLKAGYKFSPMNPSSNPNPSLDSSGGFYKKAGLPEVLVGLQPIPANPLELFSGANLDAQSAQKMAAQLQAKKTLVIFFLAPDLEAAFRKPVSSGQVFYMLPTNRINDGSLGHSATASQTVNGLTVQVKQVYADANYILVGLELTGPQGRQVADIINSSFSLSETGGANQAKFPTHSWTTDGNKPVVVFDSSAATLTGKEVKVKLVVNKLGVTLRDAQKANTTPQTPRDPNTPLASPTQPTADLEAAPFEFELTIPVETSREVKPAQTVNANGTELTLERVTITPLGAKFYLKTDGTKLDTNTLTAQLEIAGKIHTNTSFKALAGNTQLQIELYNSELITQTGNWKLVIGDSKAGQSENWQFQFAS